MKIILNLICLIPLAVASLSTPAGEMISTNSEELLSNKTDALMLRKSNDRDSGGARLYPKILELFSACHEFGTAMRQKKREHPPSRNLRQTNDIAHTVPFLYWDIIPPFQEFLRESLRSKKMEGGILFIIHLQTQATKRAFASIICSPEMVKAGKLGPSVCEQDLQVRLRENPPQECLKQITAYLKGEICKGRKKDNEMEDGEDEDAEKRRKRRHENVRRRGNRSYDAG
ncbi:hypothetical protein CEXT_465041 [Caerostris extrusa]|uniref:Uncharacterized protein n=1 Tax=Caerostris extrusa TaxID=172846 RepID=A0AAV4YCE3_CAEEX|nr:hypothetical protein CEXT_465041 [Caerostris extrusa]